MFQTTVQEILDHIDRFRPLARSPQSEPYLLNHGHPTRHVAVVAHGLTDSPGHVRAIGELLHRQGMNVLGVRLDGHGTLPEHLLDVTAEEWIKTVHQSVVWGKNLGEKIVFVGFSCGAAVLTNFMLRGYWNPTALILVAPALGLATRLESVLPYLRWIKSWKDLNPKSVVEDDPFGYNKMPLNGAYQLSRICDEIQRRRDKWKLSCPVFLGTSSCDVVVSRTSIQQFYNAQDPALASWFDHPKADNIEHFLIPRPDLNPKYPELEKALLEFCSKWF